MSSQLLKRVFYCEHYVVAYRYTNDNTTQIFSQSPSFELIQPGGFSWYADPFPFLHKGKHYIFVEAYNIWHSHADIAVYCIEDNNEKPKTIIKEPFHMSYPNVFRWEDEIYMLPETHEAKQLRLYRCVNFPENWELDTVLLDNVDFADSSLMIREDGIWVETMEDRGNMDYSNRFFRLDMENKTMIEFFPNANGWVNKRPAGNFIRIGESWYHALQECEKVYGEYMYIAKVDKLNEFVFNEKLHRTLKVSDYTINSTLPFIYTHTWNRCGNLEVIDLLYMKFNPFKPLVIMWRKITR